MKIRNLFIFLLSLSMLIFSSCTVNTDSGKNTDDSNVIDFQGAKTADINVRMGAGQLFIDGGAEKLMKANFVYTIPEWKPEVKYSVSNGEGDLEITQPSSMKIGTIGKNEYKWNVLLNNDTPMDLNVELGAGESNLKLSTLELKDLEVKLGAGEATIDLAGKYAEGFNADITGGVGKTTIYLPKDVGVKVNIKKGIGKLNADGFIIKSGDYVNESYGKSKVTLDIEIKAGIGEINLVLK